MPTLRADFAMSEMHTPSTQAPLACPITVFCGLQDTLVSETALKAWQRYTCNKFTMHTIDGDHFFINTARSEVLEKVQQTLLPHARSMLPPSTLGGLEEAGSSW